MTEPSTLVHSPSVKMPALIAAGVLAVSCAYEGMALAGIETPASFAYSIYHLFCMALLLAMSVWVFLQNRSNVVGALPAIGLLSVGLIATGIGDFVNSSISPIEVVSQKLTWALLCFGVGYSAYTVLLCIEFGRIAPDRRKRSWAALVGAAAVLAVANYLSWSSRIEPVVSQYSALKTGSLIFSLTLYVALPALSLAIFVGSGWSTEALVLLIGTGLLPFSDLILFATWLGGDDSVSLGNYALNWIFYFGGQSLFFIGAITRSAIRSN